MQTLTAFFIWLAINIVFFVIFYFCYRWISHVSRFENRKKQIKLGMLVCALAVSSSSFLFVLVSVINFNPPGVFGRFLSFLIGWGKSGMLVAVVIIFVCAIWFFVGVIINKIRAPKKKDVEEYKRLHLFEYNGEILTKLNNGQ